MLSLAWGQHAIPIYWEILPKKGSSSLREQKKVLTLVLRLLKPYPVLVLADREFHSVQLASWLRQRKIDFALRQKKGTCIADDGAVYRALKDLNIKPGNSRFYANIALRANVRTVFKCCIYTFSYSFKLFKSLSHPCF